MGGHRIKYVIQGGQTAKICFILVVFYIAEIDRNLTETCRNSQ